MAHPDHAHACVGHHDASFPSRPRPCPSSFPLSPFLACRGRGQQEPLGQRVGGWGPGCRSAARGCTARVLPATGSRSGEQQHALVVLVGRSAAFACGAEFGHECSSHFNFLPAPVTMCMHRNNSHPFTTPRLTPSASREYVVLAGGSDRTVVGAPVSPCPRRAWETRC